MTNVKTKAMLVSSCLPILHMPCCLRHSALLRVLLVTQQKQNVMLFSKNEHLTGTAELNQAAYSHPRSLQSILLNSFNGKDDCYFFQRSSFSEVSFSSLCGIRQSKR